MRKIFLCFMLFMASVFATSFGQQPYTRGVGVYPGRISQCTAPVAHAANGAYRNLALNRMAFASSQFDDNLTAQLATDGIQPGKPRPTYLRVLNINGLLPRREREWSLDQCEFTYNVMPGSQSYLSYEMYGYSICPDSVDIYGKVAYDDAAYNSNDPYRLTVEGSTDGFNWQVIAAAAGNGLPGYKTKNFVNPDPNKRQDNGPYPTYEFDTTLVVCNPQVYNFVRIGGSAPSAKFWSLAIINFYANGKVIDMKPAQDFVSCWMSQELVSRDQEEWLYVDLGAAADIDTVCLSWIDKATKGSIQVSDDASTWKTVAKLPGGKSLTDKISCKAHGRYVRVLMQEAVASTYTLGQLDVYGRGGVQYVPKPSPCVDGDIMMLSGGNWKLYRPTEGESALTMTSPDYNDNTPQWLPATVPGTVLTSYMNIGAVPNSNYANNGLQISESYFHSNFWYRNRFNVPKGYARDHVYLNFDGINWKANIWLNGTYLGRSEGAFIRSRFEVSKLLKAGENILCVEVVCNDHYGATKEKNRMNTTINGGILGADNPTFHASVGWDWITTTRGREVGIWNDVYLSTTGAVHLSDPFVDCTLNLPDTTEAVLTPQVVVSNDGNCDVGGRLVGKIGEIEFQRHVTLKANQQQTITFDPDEFRQLHVSNPRLWWPNGYGEPFMYQSSFCFIPDEGSSTEITYNTGIRQITWNTNNETLTLFVNGRRFVGRGGNWGFSEHNLNYRGREYDAAVRYHKDMNFTMIRNWVGQIGDDEFYDACDRYGIMVWQDFWLANPCDGPDPDDEAMFEANAKDMVKRIRQHPCLALYCGRNEGYPTRTLNAALDKLVKVIHPGLPYIPSSADDVVTGHGPYWAVSPREYFELKRGSAKFHSERGMPCMMNYESLERTLAPSMLWPQGDAWGEHDYTLHGAQRSSTFDSMVDKMFGRPQSAREFCDLAQWVNYDCYRALFESRSLNRRGLLLWMTHPCWPSMVWQTYDYYLDPNAAYFGSKHGSEPLHVQWNAKTDSVEVVNYSCGMVRDLTVKAVLYDMNGKQCWEGSARTSIGEDCTQALLPLHFPADAGPVQLLRLTLTDAEGNLISRNDYMRGSEEGNFQALRDMAKAAVNSVFHLVDETSDELHYTAILTNKSDAPALMIRLNVVDKGGQQMLPVIYEDNYIHLLPGETRTLKVSIMKEDTRGQKPCLKVTGFNL
ncbi:MAG: discoidin domain-containing protein [Bacteroidales bacterium]|nr:discoidin domain-containing protein [Candidatus Sodaliphilus aphodohippi]